MRYLILLALNMIFLLVGIYFKKPGRITAIVYFIIQAIYFGMVGGIALNYDHGVLAFATIMFFESSLFAYCFFKNKLKPRQKGDVWIPRNPFQG